MDNHKEPNEQIIAYLDGELKGDELRAFESLLASQAGLREELENLKVAKMAIQHYGLTAQVSAVHHEMMHELENHPQEKSGKTIALWVRNTMKVAASLFILLFLFTTYEYVSVSSSGLYTDHQKPYTLSAERGAAGSEIEEAYIRNDYKTVISLMATLERPDDKDLFLAAQSYLSLDMPEKAIDVFHQLLQDQGTENPFREDAEYYLAMSELAAGHPAQAKVLLEKIYQDKDHLYHKQVSRWTLIRLRLLLLKNPA